MAVFTSSAISTYSIAGGIDLRSGSPVAIDGSQTSLVIDSVNVTDGVFNGSSSWATLAGLTLGTAACVTAIINASNPDQYANLWEFSPDCTAGAGFFAIDDRADTNHILLLCADGGSDYGYHQTAPQSWNAGGPVVIATQWDVSANPFNFAVAKNGTSPGNETSATVTPGTFGARTLYVGARNSSSRWFAGTISFLIVHSTWQSSGQLSGLATALSDPDSLLEEGGPTLVKYYPTADKSNAGSWTGEGDESTNLYTHISETTPNDSTYIKSPTNPSNAACRFYFGTMTNPPIAGTNHTLRYHGWATGTAELNVSVYGGDDTLISTFVHSPASASVGHLYESTLTPTDTSNWAAAGYDNSYVEFDANVS